MADKTFVVCCTCWRFEAHGTAKETGKALAEHYAVAHPEGMNPPTARKTAP